MEIRTDHIVPLPRVYLFLQVAQFLLATVVAAVAIYGLGSLLWLFEGCYSLSIVSATYFALAYQRIASRRSPKLYHRVAVLCLECMQLVWWSILTISNIGYLQENSNAVNRRNAFATAFAAAALNSILFMITLLTYSICFHRHRRSGAPSTYRQGWANGAANGSGLGGPRGKSLAIELPTSYEANSSETTLSPYAAGDYKAL